MNVTHGAVSRGAWGLIPEPANPAQSPNGVKFACVNEFLAPSPLADYTNGPKITYRDSTRSQVLMGIFLITVFGRDVR